MDTIAAGKKITEGLSKYKYALVIMGLGILLMLLPSRAEQAVPAAETQVSAPVQSVSEELTGILGQIQGVGKVRVMITEQCGSQTVYQVDEDRTEGSDGLDVSRQTVILSGSGGETGLVQSVSPPVYLGAIVVCQGADSPSVRLAVANAVSAVTGISTDRISVLKMK